jgi:hypothetical protein
MQTPLSLKSAERQAFRATQADGLWDVFIGCFLLIFALAPLLSATLGDFWSSVIFLPFWGLVYLSICRVRKQFIIPRLGTVNFGKPRQKKLHWLNLSLVSLNSLLLLVGIFVFLTNPRLPGGGLAGLLGLGFLVGFSMAGWLSDFPRLYVYGLLLFLAPLMGEWMSVNHGVAHHGFPIVFGLLSGLMILIGLALFVRVLLNDPPQSDEAA